MAWNLDGISTFDPAQINDSYSNEIILNVCSRLIDHAQNDATKMMPNLAKSWDVSGDHNTTVITFHLRDDLTFNDGRPANAHDLVWSMKRVIQLKMASAATFNEYGITEQTVDDALQAPDEKTVVMKFDKPYPAELILSNIAANRAATLLDRETIMKHEKDGDMGNRYLATHAACAGAATFNEYGITEQTVDDALQAPDEKTVVMKFDKPYPAELILSNIAANRAATLLDRETIMKHEKDGDMGNRYLATHAACAGPYELFRWNPGEAVILRASSHYWGEAPKLKQILIRHVAESETQRLLLEKGDIDVARDLTPEALEQLKKTANIQVEKMLLPAMFYWGFNMTNPIFANEKVRLAMRYLIDYDSFGETVLKDIGIPRASFMPIGTLGALDEKEGNPFKLDIQKAKQLLIEAGYPDGFETNLASGNTPYGLLIAQSIQDNAAKIGVRIKIERLAGSQLFSRVSARSFDTAILGWNSESVDPHSMASRVVYNPDNRFEARNTAYPSWHHGYFDEEINHKVEDALFESDVEKRMKKYADLQHEIMQTGPYAFLFQKYNVVAISPVIKKWSWNNMSDIFYNLIEK
ncbi:ABC transporter substrate-binding protein [Bartonella bacilliformis]|uniref:ABC transporter substrate-binding protein n=1 Tax=Bartonella bacilliformis TaxID=774 RepID=UPI003CC9674C